MSDATDIVAIATSTTGITDLIGTRIYPVVLPQDATLPAVSYHLVSQPTSVTQEVHQYRSPKWRFKAWSDKYVDLEPIAVAFATVFGSQVLSPFPGSRIEYPSANAEGHESDTHRYWRAFDVVAGPIAAGAVSQ